MKKESQKITAYIPDRGDVVWLSFDPQAGHEQVGRRPALVLSPKIYNAKTKLAIMCLVTNQIKDYPFEVALSPKSKISGVVLCDQIKSLDWPARKAKFVTTVEAATLAKVSAKIKLLVGY